MKTVSLLVLLISTAPLAAQSVANDDPTDAMMTIQPAADSSYNESFASRRKAVAMRDDPKMSNIDKGRAAVFDFAKCLYESDKAGSRQVLSSGPGKSLQAAVTSFADGRCWLRGFVSFRPTTLQGAVFTTAYRAEFRNDVPALPAEPIDYAVAAGSVDNAVAARYVALRKFGDCVVRADVEAARRVVLADIASSAEAKAFSELSPQLSACITVGQSVTLTKDLVKSTIAEVLYRNATQSALAKVGR